MQQLSLFDTGGEQPKEIHKKNVSKTEKASAASSENLFAETPETIENTATHVSTDFVVEELEQENTYKITPPKELIVEDEKGEEDEKKIVQKRGRKSFKEIDSEVDLIDVPSDEELYQKQYYPISVVAKWFRVNASLLRFWENQFKILKPKKNKKGDRFFRPEDVKNLKLIYHLLRQKKLTISGANQHLKAHKEYTEENLQLINTLNNFKNFLLELKANAV